MGQRVVLIKDLERDCRFQQQPPMHLHPSPPFSPNRAFIQLAIAALLQATCLAATFEVTTAADSGTGSLRQAMISAGGNGVSDTITFTGLVFTDAVPDFIDLASPLPTVLTEIVIDGPGADKLSIRRPANAPSKFRIIDVLKGGDLQLSALTITGGDRTGVSGGGGPQGGGIYSQFGVLTLNRVNVTGNGGGGIYAVETTLSITDSLISGNDAMINNGGGIATSGGVIKVIGSSVNGNKAVRGGGISANGGNLTMVRCSVSGNTLNPTYPDFSAGGAIFSTDGAVTLVQSTISGHTAYRFGGGISHSGGSLNLLQTTVSGNSAPDGGGIWVGYSAISSRYASNVTISQCTIFGNTSTTKGGGIYSWADQGTLSISNSIICGNPGGNYFKPGTLPTLTLAGRNLLDDASLQAGENVIIGDPMLSKLQYNGGPTLTHALLSGSPAIDAVNSSPIPADTFDLDGDLDFTEPLPLDQRGNGFTRTNGILDIGAFELAKYITVTADTTSQEEGTGSGKTAFTFTVSRPGTPAVGAVTASYFVTGAGVNGADFGGSLPAGTVTIPDGMASTTLTLEVTQDTTPEADEAFTVTLSNPDNGYAIVGQGASGIIRDDDTFFVSIAAIDSTADENKPGPGIWRITRTGSVGGSLIVPLRIDASSTALAADWTQAGAMFASLAPGSTGTITIPQGAASAEMTLTPSADIHAEASETVRLNILSDAAYTIGSPASATVTIGQNDFVVIHTNDAGEGSLRQAMTNSNNLGGAETITFEGGVFTDDSLPDIIDLASRLPSLDFQTTVVGPGADKLIIRPRALATGFGLIQLSGKADVTLSGLTLSGGVGGIANLGKLRVDRCTISGNTESTYGGILNNGTLVVTHSTISGNNSSRGVGGGIYNLGGRTLSVFNSTISGNFSENGGGGISIVSSSKVLIANSTVSGNTAGGSGAGILNGGALTVVNSTISGNGGKGQGGGIATSSGGSKLTLANSIVAGNTAQTSPDIETYNPSNLISSNGANFVGSPVGAAGLKSTDQTFASTGKALSQLLAPLANNGGLTFTHALVNGSPAVNRGNNKDLPADPYDLDADSDTSEPLPFDQRGSGFVRLISGTVDLGAHEAFAYEPTISAARTDEDVKSSAGLVITANPADDGLTNHYKITNILNGTLYLNDGVSAISSGSYISKAHGIAGLKFLPAANLHSGNTPGFGFSVQAALNTTDEDLRGVMQSGVITVDSVNDAPTIVAPGLVDQSMEVGSELSVPLAGRFTDLDGDILGYSVLANSDSVRASATIRGNHVVLNGLANGVTQITILADDGQGGTISDRFLVSVGTAEPTPLQTSATGTLNRQNGLFELTVNVTNTTPLPIYGFRLHVDFNGYRAAHPSLQLYGATSPAGATDVYVDYPYPVQLAGVVPMKLSFYTRTRSFPSPFYPVLKVEALTSSEVPGTDAGGVQLLIVPLLDRTIRLEFPAVAGRWYRVRYGADCMNWADSPVPIQATTNPMHWIDSGPPYTGCSPAECKSRYYQINEIAGP